MEDLYAIVSNPKSTLSLVVRAVVDEGIERTIIPKRLAHKLDLDPVNYTPRCSAFHASDSNVFTTSANPSALHLFADVFIQVPDFPGGRLMKLTTSVDLTPSKEEPVITIGQDYLNALK